jgi:hypothetical protein
MNDEEEEEETTLQLQSEFSAVSNPLGTPKPGR